MQEQLSTQSEPARPGAKGRPTPKRRDQEAARRRPIVPEDRKAAAKGDRAAAREARVKQNAAMMRGEQWALMPRDRGPERQFIRDYVDARWNIAEFAMPVLLVAMVMSLFFSRFQSSWLMSAIFMLTYGWLLAGMIDMAITYRRIKKRYQAKHPGAEFPRGSGWYAGVRAFQIRRTRVPRPRVKRGEFPG
nr:DUF3043 domain-containing protein [Arsenicicoccus piscis]